MANHILFLNGKKTAREIKEAGDIDGIAAGLRHAQERLRDIPVNDLLDFFDAAGKALEKESGKSTGGEGKGTKKAVEDAGNAAVAGLGGQAKQLARFLKRDGLQAMLRESLRGDEKALDGFVESRFRGTLLTAQPRGLTVHWIAGNVELLGIYSVVQALVTKNACLVKASSRTDKTFVDLLAFLAGQKTAKLNGQKIAEAVAVVVVDRDRVDLQRALSLNADARIGWGGQEAVDAILALPKKFYCEDIVFGPKYSYAVVDYGHATEKKAETAQRLAFDVCTFDQYACSSPHTVFVEEKEPGTALKFAEALAEKMDVVTTKAIPKGMETPKKNMDILSVRAACAGKGKVFSSKNTDWTVIYSEETGLAEACFSRVVFVRPLKNLEDVAAFNSRKMQSLGLAMEPNRRQAFCRKVTANGIDRCPRVGDMTPYDWPWDGLYVAERLVRWVSASR